jgi:hypothetical protein
MSATTTLESLREVLAGEHSQLESWVQESFSAMDGLHTELAEWQRELTRQQAVLDQRESALEDERRKSAEQHRELTEELRELRRLLERQGGLLERLTDGSPTAEVETADGNNAGSSDDRARRRSS